MLLYMLFLGILFATAAQAIVVNIAADGSSLKIPQPWQIVGPRFCPPGTQPLHGFRLGDIEANLCLGNTSDLDAHKLSQELLKDYRQSVFRGKDVGDLSEEAKLQGGVSLWHFTFNAPPGFIMPGHAAVMDAFFKRGKATYFYVVTKPLKARDIKTLHPELESFEKTAKDSFHVLERVRWPK